MNIGDFAMVEYSTGELFSGEVRKVRTMPPCEGSTNERTLFTLKVNEGYRSMYLDKCISCAVFDKGFMEKTKAEAMGSM